MTKDNTGLRARVEALPRMNEDWKEGTVLSSDGWLLDRNAVIAIFDSSHATQDMEGGVSPIPTQEELNTLKTLFVLPTTIAVLVNEIERLRSLDPSPAPQETAGETVAMFRTQGCADWYEGHADHADGGGPYEERTLYTHPNPKDTQK